MANRTKQDSKYHRSIGELRREIAASRRALRSFISAVGDDMGCDGSDIEAKDRRELLADLERELADRLAARATAKTYRLGSSPMVCAVGIIAYLQSMYRTDRGNAVRILTAGWAVPKPAAHKLLSGAVTHKIEDPEVVVFTA